MAKNTKLSPKDVLQLINEEAHIITRKSELYKEIQKIESELKNLNECMGLAGRGMVGTMGFKSPNDVTAKGQATGFVNPMNISHITQLAQDMGMENPYDTNSEKGFGDELNPIAESNDVMAENERLKKELSELKAMLGKK
jgi:hypothetical protein